MLKPSITLSKAIASNEVIDVLDAVGLNKPNIAILSDEFLEEVRNMKQRNLAVELLNRLLKGKIKSFSRRNLIQSKKFSELLENAIKGLGISISLLRKKCHK